MKLNGFALVYTGLAAIAIAAVSFMSLKNSAIAGTALVIEEIMDMRQGDMRKLNFHSQPLVTTDQIFVKADGSDTTLANYQGKVILLNFWATWCAPCRHEMPMLSELQSMLGGDNFEVVTLATGRNMLPAMEKFFDEIGVSNLPLHRDPKQLVARDMAVLGLPATVLIDVDGREIARLQGDADWSSENARAIISTIVELTAAQ